MSSSSSSEDDFLMENLYTKVLCFKNDSINEINKGRRLYGEYHHLFPQLKKDRDCFHKYMRMTLETFNFILSKIEHCLEKQWCNLHKQPILPEERLVITLRYLATGSSFRTLSFNFRLGDNTVGQIVKETTACIWENLYTEHMPIPTKNDYKIIANDFFKIWNFPNVIGALDGKHVRIMCPKNAGSMFFNYKHYFSMVLQGVADAHYRFITVDVGGYGKQSDGGTFNASTLYEMLQKHKLPIPEPEALPGTNVKVPYVFLADEAYPLLNYLLVPYHGISLPLEKECYNKRLSRARKTIECAFGIIYLKWRILSKCIEIKNLNAIENIVKCICVLHNVIINKEGIDHHQLEVYIVSPVKKKPVGRPSDDAKSVRETFTTYLCNNPLVHQKRAD